MAGNSAAAKSSGNGQAASTAEAYAAGAPPSAWGADLAYPEWIKPVLPALHQGFNTGNKYVSVPALKMGLGRYMSNPFTGYLMILRTRGRKSGEMRDAPLGYTIVGNHVYCMAGFGRQTHWLQNVLADPKVEVILPGRSFSGIAEEVTDEAERLRVMPQLLRSMGVIVGMLGMGNPWRDTPEAIAAKCEDMPLVRVAQTGIAAGPEDPGGRYWIVPLAAGALVGIWWLGRRRRKRS